MAVVACQHCGKEKAKDAKTCVHCGGKDSRVTGGCAKVAAFIVVGFVALIAISQCQDAADPEGAAKRQKAAEMSILISALENRCEDAVRARLKAPSTAKFVDGPKVSGNREDSSKYFVVGQVDAQNGFGAMLRNDYVCKLRKTGAGPHDVEVFDVAVGVP